MPRVLSRITIVLATTAVLVRGASAQPVAPPPAEPAQPAGTAEQRAMTAAESSGAGAAVPSTAANAYTPAVFDPIDADGWPVGLTPADLRGLPPCGVGQISHTPGARLSCRPPILTGPVQYAVGLDWTSGATFGNVPTIGGAHAMGVDVDFALSRLLQLGVRYELMGIGTPETAMYFASTELSNNFLAQLKLRLWSDEVARRGWTLGAGAGYAVRGDYLGGSAPLARASLARNIGMYVGPTGAVTAAAEVSYEHSFGTMPLDAVLASVRLGFEAQIREPANIDREAPGELRHTTHFEWLVSPFLGLGLGVGLRANELLSLETSAEFLFDYHRDDGKEHGLDGASWSLISGPRLQLGWPSVAPFYLQAQAGGAWVSHEPSGELRAVGQGEVGFRALFGCGSGGDLGFWLRGDLQSGEITAGGLMFRIVVGSGRGAAGGSPEACTRGDAPMLAQPYVPPPPPPPSQTVEVEVPTVPNVEAHVDAHVEVKIEPVVIDVPLGVAVGGLSVQIDPRVLPIAQLQRAGYVTVELSGSADAVATFQSQLSATLSRQGARVDAWSSVTTDATVVHAKFTIWPAGAHP